MTYAVQLEVGCVDDDGKTSVEKLIVNFGSQANYDSSEGEMFWDIAHLLNLALPQGICFDETIEPYHTLGEDYTGHVDLDLEYHY